MDRFSVEYYGRHVKITRRNIALNELQANFFKKCHSVLTSTQYTSKLLQRCRPSTTVFVNREAPQRGYLRFFSHPSLFSSSSFPKISHVLERYTELALFLFSCSEINFCSLGIYVPYSSVLQTEARAFGATARKFIQN